MTNKDSSYNSPSRGLGSFFLVGFMGSGKTHWGKIWATANHLAFIDLDEVIEKKAGKTVAEIFETKGENYFRQLEAAALRTCADLQNTIIACGGGTPCFENNMQWMNDHGITIYISCKSQEILTRVLTEQEKRPLIKKINPAELLFFIEQKVKERLPFYTQAKFIVESSQLTDNSLSSIISTSTS